MKSKVVAISVLRLLVASPSMAQGVVTDLPPHMPPSDQERAISGQVTDSFDDLFQMNQLNISKISPLIKSSSNTSTLQDSTNESNIVKALLSSPRLSAQAPSTSGGILAEVAPTHHFQNGSTSRLATSAQPQAAGVRASPATADATNAGNIGSGTLGAARLPAFGGGDVACAPGGGPCRLSTGAAAANMSPTLAAQSGVVRGDENYNTINVLNDSKKATLVNTGVSALAITHNILTGSTAPRQTLWVQTTMMGPDGGTSNANYLPLATRMVVNLPAPGLMHGATQASPIGAFFGASFVAQLNAGHILDLAGQENDVGAYSGSQTVIRVGFRAGSYGNVQGTLDDAAFQITRYGPNPGEIGWRTGLQFYVARNLQPISADGSALTCRSDPPGTKCAMSTVLDLSNFDPYNKGQGTGYMIYTGNYFVDYTGKVSAQSEAISGKSQVGSLVVLGAADIYSANFHNGIKSNGGINTDSLYASALISGSTFAVGGAPGVSCTGAPTPRYAVTRGIVTHC